MRKLIGTLLVGLVAALMAAPQLYAAGMAIGVNFTCNRGTPPENDVLLPGDQAGVIPQGNWNNTELLPRDVGGVADATGNTANIASPVAGAIVDDSGAVTPVTLEWLTNTAWDTGNTGSPNAKLMDGYADATADGVSPDATTVTIRNIPYATYDLFVYVGSDGTGRPGSTLLNGDYDTEILWTTASAGFTRFIRATSIFGDTPVLPGNYIRFRGLTDSELTVENIRDAVNPQNVGMHGFQILKETDGGGIPDLLEVALGLNPNNAADDGGDLDSDGLSNEQEYDLGTNPQNPDSDGDLLLDGQELDLGTNPLLADTDGDTLLDGLEHNSLGTDPTKADTDGDIVRDNLELRYGSDPKNPASTPGTTVPAISVNVVGGGGGPQGAGGPPSIDPAQTAGVIPKRNWNNIAAGSPATGGPSPLIDDTGAATGATVSWGSNNLWTGPSTVLPPESGDDRLMTGYLDTGNTATTGARLTIASLPTTFADGFYDVIVYCEGENNGARAGDYTIGVTTLSAQDPGNFATGTGYVESDGKNTPGNYLVFKGLTGAGFTLTALAGNTGGGAFSGFRAPINGIQILKIALPDNDLDGMPNEWETDNGLNPSDPTDATQDPDADGLNNLQEFTLGLNPQDPDADDDGLLDGQEIVLGTNPVNADSDADGLADGREVNETGTDPLDPDTDGDRFGDLYEVTVGTDPKSAASNPAPEGSTPAIGINFVGGGDGSPQVGANFIPPGPPPIAADQQAGVFRQANWNNVAAAVTDGAAEATGGPVPLVDDSGTLTAATVSWTSNNLWTSGSTVTPPVSGDDRLMTGYLDTGDSETTGASVTVTGLASVFGTDPYKVIVYADGDSGPPTIRTGDYTIGATTLTAQDPGNFAQGTLYVISDGAGGMGNVVVFDSVTGDSFTLTAIAGWVGDVPDSPRPGFRAPINGIQIISAAAPPHPEFDITAITATGSEVTISWNAVAGTLYRILAGANPGQLTGEVGQITATGSSASFTEPMIGAGARFYQVVTGN